MLLQTDLVDECEFCIKNILWLIARQNIHKDGYNSVDDLSVALSLIVYLTVYQLRIHPHLTLTSFYQMAVVFVTCVDAGTVVTLVYNQLVYVQPIILE